MVFRLCQTEFELGKSIYYYIAESASGPATWVRPFQDFFRLPRKKKILFRSNKKLSYCLSLYCQR